MSLLFLIAFWLVPLQLAAADEEECRRSQSGCLQDAEHRDLLAFSDRKQDSRKPGVMLMQLKPGSAIKSSIKSLDSPNATQTDTTIADLQLQVQSLQRQMKDLSTSVRKQLQACGCKGRVNHTTATTTWQPSLCAAFGDPHFITFDGAQTTFVGQMVLWIVKSQNIWLQALSRGSEGRFMGFAAGGPFLNGHKLVVLNVSDGGPLRVFWDDVPVLQQNVSEFHVDGLIDAYRTQEWDSSVFDERVLQLRTRQMFAVGPFPERFMSLPVWGLYLFKLPQLQVTLTGVDFISAVFAMEAQAGGQSGYCGNFNGNPDDDSEPIAPSWDRPVGDDLGPVDESLVLFNLTQFTDLIGQEPLLLSQTFADFEAKQTQSLIEKKLKVDNCLPALLAQAEEACKDLNAQFHQDCIFDVCATGEISVALSLHTAEILQEKLNARGLPLFKGHGECLDQKGRRYRAFATKLRTDQECQQLLRDMALVKGVMGAQLQRGETCQVLVTPGSNPTAMTISGGWGSRPAIKVDKSSLQDMLASNPPKLANDDIDDVNRAEIFRADQLDDELATGIISGTTKDAKWNCWQLN